MTGQGRLHQLQVDRPQSRSKAICTGAGRRDSRWKTKTTTSPGFHNVTIEQAGTTRRTMTATTTASSNDQRSFAQRRPAPVANGRLPGRPSASARPTARWSTRAARTRTGHVDDACDTDDDDDGDSDGSDHCPLVSNPDQANTTATPQGDACDQRTTTTYGDLDVSDNCPLDANSGSGEQRRRTPKATLATTDDGQRRRADGSDNCSLVANDDQANHDADAQGDACDTTTTVTALLDGSDNCAIVSQTRHATPIGGDGMATRAIRHGTDTDGDGSTIPSTTVRWSPNTDQANHDADAQGDALRHGRRQRRVADGRDGQLSTWCQPRADRTRTATASATPATAPGGTDSRRRRHSSIRR
jgi:hypothetical protein